MSAHITAAIDQPLRSAVTANEGESPNILATALDALRLTAPKLAEGFGSLPYTFRVELVGIDIRHTRKGPSSYWTQLTLTFDVLTSRGRQLIRHDRTFEEQHTPNAKIARGAIDNAFVKAMRWALDSERFREKEPEQCL